MHLRAPTAIDSTDLKTSIRRDWMSNKWSKKWKGRIKLHVYADTEKIIASHIYISSEKNQYATQFSRLITGPEERVYADNACGSRGLFNALANDGTEAVIPLRNNYSSPSR